MKKCCLVLAAFLLLYLPIPVQAENAKYSFTNSQEDIISTTLYDAGDDGIQFGTVLPGDAIIYGDASQSNGVPGISLVIEAGTNTRVDINVKGQANGALSLENWRYSTTYFASPAPSDVISLENEYPALPVYNEVPAGSYAFYQWISIPAGTDAATYTATIWFKVEDE